MNSKLRILVVEDESFTRQLISNTLSQQGFVVRNFEDASTAIEAIESFEPHVVISDLDLGPLGASGIDLLQYVSRNFPWIGLVALTAHADPKLAAAGSLPEQVAYLVKSEINDLGQIGLAIRATLSNRATAPSNDSAGAQGEGEEGILVVSGLQAEALRMLASGMTNQAIADARGTSLRAVETLISRTYASLGLGLERENRRNYRIEAVRLWQTGRVRVE